VMFWRRPDPRAEKHSSYLRKHDLGSLKHLYLAGEPLDDRRTRGSGESSAAGDRHYWQTETGWPLLSGSGRGDTTIKMARQLSRLRLRRPAASTSRRQAVARVKRRGAIAPPLRRAACPPCGAQTRARQHVFPRLQDQLIYSTFDWGIRDADGYYYILVAHRRRDQRRRPPPRTREIEEAVNMHPKSLNARCRCGR